MTTYFEIINLYTKYHYRLILPVTLNMKEEFISTYHLYLDILVSFVTFQICKSNIFFLKSLHFCALPMKLILKKGEVFEVLILLDDVMILSFHFVFGCD